MLNAVFGKGFKKLFVKNSFIIVLKIVLGNSIFFYKEDFEMFSMDYDYFSGLRAYLSHFSLFKYLGDSFDRVLCNILQQNECLMVFFVFCDFFKYHFHSHWIFKIQKKRSKRSKEEMRISYKYFLWFYSLKNKWKAHNMAINLG